MTDYPRLIVDQANRPVVETRFRVRFHETDAMAVVHHTAYIKWFEEGRSELTRAVAYPYARMAAEGVNLAVVDVSAHYHRPARYDDEVIVATRMTELTSRSISFSYEVRRASDGLILVTGSTRHVSVDRDGRMARMPEQAQMALGAAAGNGTQSAG